MKNIIILWNLKWISSSSLNIFSPLKIEFCKITNKDNVFWFFLKSLWKSASFKNLEEKRILGKVWILFLFVCFAVFVSAFVLDSL